MLAGICRAETWNRECFSSSLPSVLFSENLRESHCVLDNIQVL